MTLKSYSKLFIGGRWGSPSSEGMLGKVSPATEDRIASLRSGERRVGEE